MPGLTTALAAACASVACGSGAAGSPAGDHRAVRPLGATTPLSDQRLSDELRLTRYAGATARVPVRLRASAAAPAVGRLHYLTEDGPFEVYPVLASHVGAGGRVWLRVRLPCAPTGGRAGSRATTSGRCAPSGPRCG